jgi:hypothetical protein
VRKTIACCEIECDEFPAYETNLKNDPTKLEIIEKDGTETAQKSEPKKE